MLDPAARRSALRPPCLSRAASAVPGAVGLPEPIGTPPLCPKGGLPGGEAERGRGQAAGPGCLLWLLSPGQELPGTVGTGLGTRGAGLGAGCPEPDAGGRRVWGGSRTVGVGMGGCVSTVCMGENPSVQPDVCRGRCACTGLWWARTWLRGCLWGFHPVLPQKITQRAKSQVPVLQLVLVPACCSPTGDLHLPQPLRGMEPTARDEARSQRGVFGCLAASAGNGTHLGRRPLGPPRKESHRHHLSCRYQGHLRPQDKPS